jgi:glucose-1-phosphatase
MPHPPKALLFDLGRVIFDLDFNRAIATWAGHAGCDPAQLKSRYSADAAYKSYEMGGINEAEYFQSLRHSLGINITDAQFLEGWNAIFLEEMPGIADHLALAAKSLPLFAFSNTNPAHEAHWSKRYAKTLSHFKTVFVSSTIKLRKPDADAFHYVAKAIGVAPASILFFDDSPENIEGARAIGMQAAHVVSHHIVPQTLDTILKA